MKHSVNKIFKNLNTFLLTLVALGLISSFFVIEQFYSYKKIDNLKNQSMVVTSLLKEEEKSNKIDMLQFNSKVAKLHPDIDRLLNRNQYNYISNLLTDYKDEYIADLNKLHTLVNNFNKHSRNYFNLSTDDENFQLYFQNIKSQHNSIVSLINSMMIKNISYDNARFNIFNKIFFLFFIILAITAFWYKNRLLNIYNDITFLYSAESNKKNMNIFSQEADAILLRMKRKSALADNPAMMDTVTEIYNNKGMIQSYTEKKSMKDNQFTSVTVLEIDNFSKSKRSFSQEFTQEILKKVAYSISLHEQVTDTIARTDYNQFTLILSRSTKEQSFKDVDLVRQSISEIKLVTPDREKINITVTGAFIIKASKSPLEDSIRKAKELLQNTRDTGTNKIAQISNLSI